VRAPILSLRDVSRAFVRRGRAVAALGGVSLDVAAGVRQAADASPRV